MFSAAVILFGHCCLLFMSTVNFEDFFSKW